MRHLVNILLVLVALLACFIEDIYLHLRPFASYFHDVSSFHFQRLQLPTTLLIPTERQ